MEIRNFRWEDLPQLVDFMNRYAEAHARTSRVTQEQIERTWRTPYNHPERDAFVALDEDGMMVGYTIADLQDEPHFAYGVYQVLPGYAAAGRDLMDITTAYFREVALANSAADVPVMMDWRLSHEDTDAIALCEAQKMQQVRQFYTMRRSLNQPVPVVDLPAGFSRQPFTAAKLADVYAAKVEIFEDHWGGQYDTLDEWRYQIERPDFDPALWWVVYSGDDIAGMVLSQPSSQKSAEIGIVGVRRAWRKKGLAQKMLLLCFLEYQKRGFTNLYLGVDSNSQTNAVKLYQRVGMDIHHTILFYRHVLRSG